MALVGSRLVKFLASLVLYGFWGGHIGMQISGMGKVAPGAGLLHQLHQGRPRWAEWIAWAWQSGGQGLHDRAAGLGVPPGETLVARMRDAPQEADLGG